MSTEAAHFADVTNAREYLDALDAVENHYLALGSDVERMANQLADINLSDDVRSSLEGIPEALAEIAASVREAATAFHARYDDLLELVESGKDIPGLDPFFADCES